MTYETCFKKLIIFKNLIEKNLSKIRIRHSWLNDVSYEDPCRKINKKWLFRENLISTLNFINSKFLPSCYVSKTLYAHLKFINKLIFFYIPLPWKIIYNIQNFIIIYVCSFKNLFIIMIIMILRICIYIKFFLLFIILNSKWEFLIASHPKY